MSVLLAGYVLSGPIRMAEGRQDRVNPTVADIKKTQEIIFDLTIS